MRLRYLFFNDRHDRRLYGLRADLGLSDGRRKLPERGTAWPGDLYG